MNIFHCLFWIWKDTVTSLRYQETGLAVMEIDGEQTIPLTESFWEKWKTFSKLHRNDKIDFCLIYDKELPFDEMLFPEQCPEHYRIWNRKRIEEAVHLLQVSEAIEIRDSNGKLLLRPNCFLIPREKANITPMTARYTEAENQPEFPDEKPAFLKHYIEKLQQEQTTTKRQPEQTDFPDEKPAFIKYYEEKLKDYESRYKK